MPMENPPNINENRAASESMPVAHEPIVGKIVLIVAVALLILGVGFAGWWLYNRFFVNNSESILSPQTSLPGQSLSAEQQSVDKSLETVPVDENNSLSDDSPSPLEVPDSASKIKSDSILFGEDIDTDKDALGDTKERELGTDVNNSDSDADGLKDGEEISIYLVDPLKADTDGDGLADGEEVNLWHTNPINPDTDGDTYPDGKEVKNGYNPLGPGKLSVTSTAMAKSLINSTTTKK
jgi:hypothetical protein